MLSYVEFAIVFIIALIFLKPKDIVYIISYIKDISAKIKHLLYIGKEEINKIIDETTINDLKEKSTKIIENNPIKETKNILDETKKTIENEVSDIYKSVNLNYKLDNVLNSNSKKDDDNKKENNTTSLNKTNN